MSRGKQQRSGDDCRAEAGGSGGCSGPSRYSGDSTAAHVPEPGFWPTSIPAGHRPTLTGHFSEASFLDDSPPIHAIPCCRRSINPVCSRFIDGDPKCSLACGGAGMPCDRPSSSSSPYRVEDWGRRNRRCLSRGWSDDCGNCWMH